MCSFFGLGYMGWFGGIFMVLFWALIIGLIIWGFSRMSGYGRHMHPEYGDRALDTAKMRYAKGEISKEEFERIKNDLA